MNKPPSLNAQLQEVRYVLDHAYTMLRLRKSEIDLHKRYMRAVERTLEWIMANEGHIRSYMDERRRQSLSEGMQGEGRQQ